MYFNASSLFLFLLFTYILNLNFFEDIYILNTELLSYSSSSYLFFLVKPFLSLYNFVTLNFTNFFSFKLLTINSLTFTFKFVLVIALLVFIRGGVPRYRYDFLTKIGWIKFLSLILSMFLSSLLLVYLF